MPSVTSVHCPTALGNISIVGKKKVKHMSLEEVNQYAKEHGVSYVTAYRFLTSTAYFKANKE